MREDEHGRRLDAGDDALRMMGRLAGFIAGELAHGQSFSSAFPGTCDSESVQLSIELVSLRDAPRGIGVLGIVCSGRLQQTDQRQVDGVNAEHTEIHPIKLILHACESGDRLPDEEKGPGGEAHVWHGQFREGMHLGRSRKAIEADPRAIEALREHFANGSINWSTKYATVTWPRPEDLDKFQDPELREIIAKVKKSRFDRFAKRDTEFIPPEFEELLRMQPFLRLELRVGPSTSP